MRKKFTARKAILCFFILFLSSILYAGGVLSSPRKVYVVTTKHFDIIFPKDSSELARHIADTADSLYDQAKEAAGLTKDYFIPIVITPDSAVLDVKYTNSPYNRIVIYDAVGNNSQTGFSSESDDIILSLLYKEIFRALSCSVRSPFNQLVYKLLLHDPYQPIALVNLPFSFVEAYADIAAGTANDQYFQQLLIQAKIEGKFPTWFQTTAIRDIHPGNDLCYAAASGFAAFLMQTRGIEKYCEFWEECGKLHPYFMNGIFYKIYGETLASCWKKFESSVPLPQNMEQMNGLDIMSREVSENDRQGAFENILYTNYGVVWYDSIRHEVDIYDPNSTFKIRQLLFIADNIKKLSLSPDGRYVTASFTRTTIRPEFKEWVTRIFDLRERKFLDHKFMLKDAAFIETADGQVMIAGISVDEKNSVLKVYPFDLEEEKVDAVYERSIEKNIIPFSISGAGRGNLSYLLRDSEGTKLAVENLATSEIRSWTFSDDKGNEISPFFSQYAENLSIFTFSYYPKDEGTLARSGFISVSADGDDGRLNFENVILQDCDISGGVYYPVVAEGKLYYCARKFSHNELRYLPQDFVPFTEGSFEEQPLTLSEPEKKLFLAEQVESQKKLGNDLLKVYNPFKYMLNVSFTPLLAVRDITLEKGPVYWPSLGINVKTDADPMRNTELILSGGLDFLLLSFEKEFNTVPKENQTLMNQTYNKIKKFNFAGYIENSSTPVDIAAGALFKFNSDGNYDFKAVGKTGWTIPVGNILRNIDFTISSIYLASTEYYDENKIEYYPPMEGWTKISDAYQLMEVSFSAMYSNSHQYGISQYERRGLTLGGRIYSLWDIYEINILNKYRDATKQDIKDGKNTELTEAQLDSLYKENVMNVSQLNLGLTTEIEIPRLTPLEIHKGWVLSLPSVIRAEYMNKAGTALEASVESLLLGNEIQNGFPFLYLYFSRMGLKGGYKLKLDYDTTKVLLPDIRRDNYMVEIFKNTVFSDSVYMIFNTNFLVPTGKLSEVQFNMDFRGEYFLKTNGFKISFNISAVF